MNPDDFQLDGYWRQGTRGPNRDGRRPIYKLTHPEDAAFGAVVRLVPSLWMWEVHGRVGSIYGSDPRKRRAMWAAIHALNEYFTKSTP